MRYNRKWTRSERRGYATPAQERYLEQQRQHLKNQQQKRDREPDTDET
jgi:hypothetical protein